MFNIFKMLVLVFTLLIKSCKIWVYVLNVCVPPHPPIHILEP